MCTYHKLQRTGVTEQKGMKEAKTQWENVAICCAQNSHIPFHHSSPCIFQSMHIPVQQLRNEVGITAHSVIFLSFGGEFGGACFSKS